MDFWSPLLAHHTFKVLLLQANHMVLAQGHELALLQSKQIPEYKAFSCRSEVLALLASCRALALVHKQVSLENMVSLQMTVAAKQANSKV